MTAADLRALLLASGLPASLWQFPDSTYEPVSEAWVLKNWEAWLEARPRELVVFESFRRARPLWLKDVGDCDNLALGTMVHGQVGNALASVNRGGLERGGLAYGILFYHAIQRVQGGHSINWFVDLSGELRFFEPGTGQLVKLYAQERSSAWFGLAA